MKIHKSFGFVLEEKSEVFSSALLEYLKSATENHHGEDFPKKFQKEKIEFTFSTGQRESKGKTFILKRWVKTWGYYNQRKTIIIFEAVEDKE